MTGCSSVGPSTGLARSTAMSENVSKALMQRALRRPGSDRPIRMRHEVLSCRSSHVGDRACPPIKPNGVLFPTNDVDAFAYIALRQRSTYEAHGYLTGRSDHAGLGTRGLLIRWEVVHSRPGHRPASITRGRSSTVPTAPRLSRISRHPASRTSSRPVTLSPRLSRRMIPANSSAPDWRWWRHVRRMGSTSGCYHGHHGPVMLRPPPHGRRDQCCRTGSRARGVLLRRPSGCGGSG